MGGLAKRMRPHSLYTPKPLMRLCGKPVLDYIMEEISAKFSLKEVVYIVPPFFDRRGHHLYAAKKINYCTQESPEGTAHAIMCAREYLKGEIIIIFPDAIIQLGEVVLPDEGGIIFTSEVNDPSSYGVVITDGDGRIIDMVEKPSISLSNLAITGVYYIRGGEKLVSHLEMVLSAKLPKGKEYHLTDALRSMAKNGYTFYSYRVERWLDCGNVEQFLKAQECILKERGREFLIEDGAIVRGSTIGENVYIEGDCEVLNSRLEHCIIYRGARIENCNLKQSIIGEYSTVKNVNGTINAGPYSQIEGV